MEKIDIKEVVEYRDHLYNELTSLIQKIQGIDQRNPQRIKQVERIRSINKELEKIESLYARLAIFNADEFSHFMTQFLILTEGNYVRTRIHPRNSTKATHYVISSKETKEFLKEHIKTSDDVERFFRAKTPSDVTKIEGPTVYPFDKSLKMKNDFAKHPRLKDAIYEFMQIKASFPAFLDTEIFDIVLNNTLRRNLKRSEDLYYKKRRES